MFDHLQVLPRGVPVPFKFVLTGKRGEVQWQPGENLKLHTMAVAPHIEVEVPWDASEPLVITNLEPADPLLLDLADVPAFTDDIDVAEGFLKPPWAQSVTVPEYLVTSKEVAELERVAGRGVGESGSEDRDFASADQVAQAVDDLVTDDEEEIVQALMEKSNGVALFADALGPSVSNSSTSPDHD